MTPLIVQKKVCIFEGNSFGTIFQNMLWTQEHIWIFYQLQSYCKNSDRAVLGTKAKKWLNSGHIFFFFFFLDTSFNCVIWEYIRIASWSHLFEQGIYSVSSEAEYKHLPKIQLIFKIPLYYKAFQTSEKHIKSYFEHLKL